MKKINVRELFNYYQNDIDAFIEDLQNTIDILINEKLEFNQIKELLKEINERTIKKFGTREERIAMAYRDLHLKS